MIESADEFVRLRTSENMAEYDRAANEEAPLAVWHEVIERFPEMRSWVAHNKTVPHSILRILSDDPDREVRWWVAQKRKLERDVMEKLASDPDESVRQRIAVNARTPESILRRLARDPSWVVREPAQERLGEFVGPSELDRLIVGDDGPGTGRSPGSSGRGAASAPGS